MRACVCVSLNKRLIEDGDAWSPKDAAWSTILWGGEDMSTRQDIDLGWCLPAAVLCDDGGDPEKNGLKVEYMVKCYQSN